MQPTKDLPEDLPKDIPNDLQSPSRRRVLQGSVAGTAAVGAVCAGLGSNIVNAAEAQPNANKFTFALGEMEVSTLLAGSRTVPEPQNIFGMNVSADEFNAVSDENFIPNDKAHFFFTPTVVRAGDDIVLFDTGMNTEGISAPLMAAGIEPADVTIVVLTHMHPDHIGGMTDESGQPTFPNARYVTGSAEYDAWKKQGAELFMKKVAPMAEKITFIKEGESVVSGITSMSAAGHTPGHMIYMLDSGGKQLVIAADTANHYVWSLAYPDWEVKFDMDKAAAAATRKQVFGMLAADKIPFVGYHMPFPGMGYVETRGEGGFRYVPASYQMLVG